MRTLSCFIIALFFFAACQTEPSKTGKNTNAASHIDHDKTLVVPWSVDINETTQVAEIRRDPAADMSHLQPVDMVDALNLKYPQIKLTWIKLENDRAFVILENADYLTQEAGSEGAKAYLAEATYSLTEFQKIKSVDFSFKEGDHARPGVYSRADFEF